MFRVLSTASLMRPIRGTSRSTQNGASLLPSDSTKEYATAAAPRRAPAALSASPAFSRAGTTRVRIRGTTVSGAALARDASAALAHRCVATAASFLVHALNAGVISANTFSLVALENASPSREETTLAPRTFKTQHASTTDCGETFWSPPRGDPSTLVPTSGTNMVSHSFGTSANRVSPKTSHNATSVFSAPIRATEASVGPSCVDAAVCETSIATSSHSTRGVTAESPHARDTTLPAILFTGEGTRPTQILISFARDKALVACMFPSPSRRTLPIRGWINGFSLLGSAPNATAAPAAAAREIECSLCSSTRRRAADARSAPRADSTPEGPVGIAAASVTACSAPKPSAAGDGISDVVGLTLLSAAARSKPADSRFTLATKAVASAYGFGDGALGYAGFVAARISPRRAPGTSRGGLGAPTGMASSHLVSRYAPVALRVADGWCIKNVTCVSSFFAAVCFKSAFVTSESTSTAQSTLANSESALTARSLPTVRTTHSSVDEGARSSAPVIGFRPDGERLTTQSSFGSGRESVCVAASKHQSCAWPSTARAMAAALATWHKSLHALDAACAVVSSSSNRTAWNETRKAVVATSCIQETSRFDGPPVSAVPRPMSWRNVRHTARRTAAIGCAANGNRYGTTSFRDDPFFSKGGVFCVTGSAYSAASRDMTGTFEGDVRRSGSSRRPSNDHSPDSNGGNSACIGRCVDAGSSASAAAPRTSSSLSLSALVAAGSASGNNKGARSGREARTYRSASNALCRTSHSFRFRSTRIVVTTAATAVGGRGNKPAPRACAQVSRTGATTPSPT
mmetsp:Transcript_2118/g.8166  ORF Transcript_2118/g.8166 Transcript_2118/m.8166 type:complete len:804 (-) Transcript_2118:1199-3610(-)